MTVWNPKFVPEVVLPRARLSNTAHRSLNGAINSGVSTPFGGSSEFNEALVHPLSDVDPRQSYALQRKDTLDLQMEFPLSRRRELNFPEYTSSTLTVENASSDYQNEIYHYPQVPPETYGIKRSYFSELNFLATSLSFMMGPRNLLDLPLRCAQYGGVAYLIARFVALTALGLPCLFFEQFVGHFMRTGLSQASSRLLPFSKGIRLAMIASFVLLGLLDSVNIAWCASYLVFLLTDRETVVRSSGDSILNGSTVNFFRDHVLNASSTANELGDLQSWQVIGLASAWAVSLLVTLIGLSFIAKLCYVTSLGPFLALSTLLGYTIWRSTAAARDGVQHLMQPEWVHLLYFQTWAVACTDVITSMRLGFGVYVFLANFTKKTNSLLRNTFLIGGFHFLFELLATFVVACLIGSLLPTLTDPLILKELVSNVSEPYLLFHTLTLPLTCKNEFLPWFGTLLATLILLSIDSLIFLLETIATTLRVTWWRPVVLVVSSALLFLAGLPLATQGGIHIVQLLSGSALNCPEYYLTMFLMIACFATAGAKSVELIARTLSSAPNVFLQGYVVVLYTFAIPTSLIACLGYTIISSLSRDADRKTEWSSVFPWCVAGLPFCLLVSVALCNVLCSNNGPLYAKKLGRVCTRPKPEPIEFADTRCEGSQGRVMTTSLSNGALCHSMSPDLDPRGFFGVAAGNSGRNFGRHSISSHCLRTIHTYDNPAVLLQE